MDQEEYFDIYDINKNKTGVIIPRSKEKELLEGQCILVAAIIIQNENNEIMMQLTSKEKGSVFALPGGHVIHNEDSKDTIVRELFEEQAIKIDKNKIEYLGNRLVKNKVFIDLYYLKENYKKEDMILQKEEVEDVFWMTFEEILEKGNKGKVRQSSLDSVQKLLLDNGLN